jgi:hypothetical protein
MGSLDVSFLGEWGKLKLASRHALYAGACAPKPHYVLASILHTAASAPAAIP